MSIDVPEQSLEAFLTEISAADNWYYSIKRLSGNDTGLTGSHQVGLYFPRIFFEHIFPEINIKTKRNPEFFIKKVNFVSHKTQSQNVRAIYYNNKFTTSGGTRNEFRFTGWGGKSSPVQDPENTGAFFILAVNKEKREELALAWVAENKTQEDLIEEWFGTEIVPGQFYYSFPVSQSKDLEIPEEWKSDFPGGREVFEVVAARIPLDLEAPDKSLLERRDYEYQLFQQIEQFHYLPRIKMPFVSIDSFIKLANTITNRRKSRAGKSLEYHLSAIFKSHRLHYDEQVKTELNKKPDFLFPGSNAYKDPAYPTEKLSMLAAKTTCKDRWRQVVYEADRIKHKHLFTLQEGISDKQLEEMEKLGVQLVIPEKNKKKFSTKWRQKLLNLNDFINLVKAKQSQ